ncbi:MAG: peptidoglycan DD-metalloendopeptidase family protein [Clostridiales bacterium]|jgi:murein DD-endopeptidase MepM/ murein hydrolase activator NlpD|nr:peptidoglycan DD-metalloendopeptidase family protein [Clostridiales bacterium]
MRIVYRLICCAAAVLLFPASISAESIDDLKKRQEEIQNEQSAAQQQLEVTTKQKNQTEIEMEQIDAELTKATDDLLRVTDRLNRTSAELDVMELDLKAIQEHREEQYELLKQRLNFMYKNGKIGYLDIIFEAKSFPDFINRVEYINRIAKNDKTLLNKLTSTAVLAEETFNEIDKQKTSLEQLASEREDKQDDLQDTLARKQELYNRLDSDEKSYEEKMASLKETEDEIVALIKQKEKEAAEAAARLAAAGGGYASATINTSPYSGRMLWPVPGRYLISDVYRVRYNPVNGRREQHAGVDIPAPYGTSIVAAESGVVITSSWKSGYGYTVIIDHGNGITTLYGHNSRLLVSGGQSVGKGDSIALAGSTGNSTGPHCHFEVRINGSPVNPQSYLNF